MAKSSVPFAREVKDEVAQGKYDVIAKKFILSGFVRNGCSFTLGSNPSLTVHTEIASVAKLIYSCLKDCYDLDPVIRYENVTRFGKKLVYVVQVEDKRLYDIMEDLEVLESGMIHMVPKEGLHRRNLRYLCIGSFLAKGSVNNPSSKKTSYFLEIAFSDKNDAMAIKRKLDSFKEEKTMSFKYIKRREKHVLYLKKSDQISVFLSYVGATEAMFRFENIRIQKEESNITNRFTICDSANYSKTIQTAQRDIDAINTVLKFEDIHLMDERVRAVVDARLKNPDFNYRELADVIVSGQGIQITKSGVVHIISSFREKAEKYNPKA